MVGDHQLRKLPLSHYLSSLPKAPLLTQIKHGYRRVLLLRIYLALFALSLSRLYKFSFISVSTFGVRAIDDAGVIPTGFAHPLGGPMSANLQNVITKQGTSMWRFTSMASWIDSFSLNTASQPKARP
jgi:hypothetical protein